MKKAYPFSAILFERPLADGRKALYLDTRVNGKRKKIALHLFLLPGNDRQTKLSNQSTLMTAQKMLAEKTEELENKILGIENDRSHKLDSFFDFYDKCMNEKENQTRMSWSSTKSYLYRYERNRDITIAEINSQWCEGFRNYLAKSYCKNSPNKHLSEHTQCLLFSKLVACLNKAVKLGYISKNPCNNVDRIKVREVERSFLTKEELARLAKTPLTRTLDKTKRAFLFSCMCGLRFSDIKALTWDKIHEVNGKMVVSVCMEKTDAMIHVPLNATALNLIGERPLLEKTKVFPKMPSNCACNKTIETWCKSAGIDKKVTFHVARHTFATQLLANDVDIYTASKLLGHTDIKTTSIYAKVLDKTKQKAVDALDNLIEL